MGRIAAGEIMLGHREWGRGEIPVLYLHGNLASKDWVAPATPWLPEDLRIIGLDWRGCGDSDRPASDADHSNYAVEQHAEDMLHALDTLEIDRCHLATHSTGGIIAAHMQLRAPERFGRVLHLDPVSPKGLAFGDQSLAIFRAMQGSRDTTRAVMAGVASSLFRPESFATGQPAFQAGVEQLAATFERLIDQTVSAGDGIWLGTPLSLTQEREAGALEARMTELTHETLILWGALDPVIPKSDLEEMAAALPHARLVVVPGVGHSMNIEAPQMYAGYLAASFSGVPL